MKSKTHTNTQTGMILLYRKTKYYSNCSFIYKSRKCKMLVVVVENVLPPLTLEPEATKRETPLRMCM